MLDGLRGFDWDLHNVGHIARHGVNSTEVEEAFERPHAIIPAKDVGGEKRWKLFGTSSAGQYLVVVFTIRDERLRPVTAHPMNQRERRIYAPEIDKTP
ncbi:MAG: BrnT family toxin [Acidobacteriia bacterium]|nr:BrnT family toxin [Terriglobia bacterium]